MSAEEVEPLTELELEALAAVPEAVSAEVLQRLVAEVQRWRAVPAPEVAMVLSALRQGVPPHGWLIERVEELALEHTRLRELVRQAVADHDGIADTMAEPMAGPEDGRPATGWRCGCTWCLAARQLVEPPAGEAEPGKCSCGERSPARLVIHRSGQPCILRPRPPAVP